MGNNTSEFLVSTETHEENETMHKKEALKVVGEEFWDEKR